MNTMTLDGNQNRLLDEIRFLIPQYNDVEVIDVLKSAILQIRNCKKVTETARTTDESFSPKIQSLIGIVPPFSQEEIDSDERLKHIMNH